MNTIKKMVSWRVALSLPLLVAGALMYGHTQSKDVVAQTKRLGRVKPAQVEDKSAQVNETAPADTTATQKALKNAQQGAGRNQPGGPARDSTSPRTAYDRKRISKYEFDRLDGSVQIEVWIPRPITGRP